MQVEQTADLEADDATLTISPEKVCFIIVKAREFDEGRIDGAGSRIESFRLHGDKRARAACG
jgi:hypothetical protein